MGLAYALFSSIPGLNLLNISSVPSPSGDGQKYLQASPGDTIAPGQVSPGNTTAPGWESVPVHRRRPKTCTQNEEAHQAYCTMKAASSRKPSLMPPVQPAFSWALIAPCTHPTATSSEGRNCILFTTGFSIPSLATDTKYMLNRYL